MALADTIAELRGIFPYLPTQVLTLLAQGFIETGDAEGALNNFRDSDAYERYFPGNRREDGTLRYDEAAYFVYTERARIAVSSIGVNPDVFGDQIVAALAGDVSIGDLERRIDAVYESVIDRAPEVRAYYANAFGIELSDAAIVASVLDPDVGNAVLEGRLTTAEIGGEAALRGFGINLQVAESLRQRGVTGESAGELFSQAAESVPVLEVLARRHNDPNDEFNLDTFLQASVFDDPVERRRMRRLVAQERASFTGGSVARDRESGAMTGLLGG